MTTVRLAEQPTTSPSEVWRTLPPELMAEVSWRLGSLGLIYAVSGIVGHFGRRLLLAVTGTIEPGLRIQEVFGLAAIAMGFAVYVIARRGMLSSKRLLDLGLVFQVAGAFGIAASAFWDGVPGTLGTFTLVPAECVWIVAFPLVVPNTPNRILVSSLLAATAGPAAVALSSALTGKAVDRPLALAVYFLTSNYLCAVAAYAVSRIVYRMGARLTRAREIGSYELVERIGEGGMGEVWQAKHRLLARPAAIKLIRADVLGASQRSREAIIRRFEREAQDTSTLGSTHTIDVYDFGITEDGDFYYVMELLNGISLERAVREFGPLEPARAVHLLRQVCHSLGEAHSRGLVHRDIKPANIFMCRLGPDDDFVKVLDFGLVKHFEADPSGSMLTMEGVTAGTPGYMAPEIALGHAGVDGRADIYSLGCVAYYLLTGQPVFSGETPVATVLAHVQAQPVPPSARSEIQIPQALDSLILECLAKEPGARPATATALAQRLAGSVSEDGWTEEDARQWWDLHRVSLAVPGAAGPREAAGEPADTPKRLHRCWPKFDRTPKL
jgi:serine/threonine-protein kinase